MPVDDSLLQRKIRLTAKLLKPQLGQAMKKAFDTVAAVAVGEFMEVLPIGYKGSRAGSSKLGIRTTRLSRSILGQEHFDFGNESIRRLEWKGINQFKAELIGTIGSSVPYAAVHEYGYKTTPPRPYLNPALQKSEKEIDSHFIEAVENVMGTVW